MRGHDPWKIYKAVEVIEKFFLRTNGWANRQMDERTDEQTAEGTGEWTDKLNPIHVRGRGGSDGQEKVPQKGCFLGFQHTGPDTVLTSFSI